MKIKLSILTIYAMFGLFYQINAMEGRLLKETQRIKKMILEENHLIKSGTQDEIDKAYETLGLAPFTKFSEVERTFYKILDRLVQENNCCNINDLGYAFYSDYQKAYLTLKKRYHLIEECKECRRGHYHRVHLFESPTDDCDTMYELGCTQNVWFEYSARFAKNNLPLNKNNLYFDKKKLPVSKNNSKKIFGYDSKKLTVGASLFVGMTFVGLAYWYRNEIFSNTASWFNFVTAKLPFLTKRS